MALAAPVAIRELRPPLKWAGGKRWLVPYLRELWPSEREHRLVEPFAGGLAVALGLAPTTALLNDINEHVINFYSWVQRGLTLSQEFGNDETDYYLARRRFNDLIRAGRSASREAAQLFYYLNRTGFNGLCRFNRRGEYNVPFGRYRSINYALDLAEYRHMLASWEFSHCDFEALTVRPGDFVYADPPYDVEFTSYSQSAFRWEEQLRLARWLASLEVPVIASNQATDRILRLYGELGFEIRTLMAPRRISCNGDRRPAREMLATLNLNRALC